ncbi:MAG: hypothetical protein HY730_06630 [Candidatus Tectomicrobia bacterium]|uniref:Rhodanese domain-containing protein n=1 Tax=Tectimicrobiota bacterium TaxID=2528274 RepID=A0A933LQC4_UNCTE|nr:hypothetical protein [Candidatus Tectomicrobia bacterium]
MGVETKISVADVPRLTPQEVRERTASGERIIIVDARERASFDVQHIEGALSIPLAEIGCLPEMMSGRESWVFYCT